jgi:hypothetical protein
MNTAPLTYRNVTIHHIPEVKAKMNAQAILEQLTEAYAQRDLLNMDQAKQCNDAIPEEVIAKLAEINLTFAPKIDAVDEKITLLEAQAKAAVLEAGETVKGSALQAVFVKGRTSWDSKMLNGLSIVIPEILQACTVGQPTVTIRKVG